jgi:hypothetical protein
MHAPVEHTLLAMHCAAVVQLVAHAVVPQTYGVHCEVDTAGQAPAPLQPAARVCVPLAQLAARQLVDAPGKLQVALVPPHVPAHTPVPAQAGWPVRGAPLTKLHVPGLPVLLQYSHAPAHAELQHTPSAQMPLVHSSTAAQAVPFAFLAVHIPALQ